MYIFVKYFLLIFVFMFNKKYLTQIEIANKRFEILM